MTDAEMIDMVIKDRQMHSLENITISRGADGCYVISAYRGTSICDKREALLDILGATLDVQDEYFQRSGA